MCLPVALILGILGIVLDGRKWLAILTTVLACGGLLLLFVPFLVAMLCA